MKNVFRCLIVALALLRHATVTFAQINFTEHTIVTNYNSWSVVALDMDQDGDIDVVGSARLGNRIDWWKNDGDQNFTRQLIANNANYAMGVAAADLDLDNDIDVVCGLNQVAKIKWYENNGSFSFTEHTIANWVVNRIYLTDVNGDGLIDIVASACEQGDNKIGWFENNGAGRFTAHVVKAEWDHANSIYATDLDRDGDVDLLGTASFRTAAGNGEIAWFENDGTETFTMHKIKENYGRPSSVHAADVDLDGDVDVLATVCGINLMMWFENDGSQNFSPHVIGTNFRRPHDVSTADLDNDGDIDILGAAIDGNDISWWENDGAKNFTKHAITTNLMGATEIFIQDLDQDGDLDILGAAQFSNKISWFENSLHNLTFSTELTSGHAPLTTQFYDQSNIIPPTTYRAWDFDNDGTIDSYQQNPTWTYAEPGIYSVSLLVANDVITKKIVYKDYIQVFAGASALLFNGLDSYVACPAAPGLNLVADVTVEAWIKPAGWGSTPNRGLGRIVDKNKVSIFLNGAGGSLNSHSLCIWLETANGSPGFANSPANSISLEQWQHVAITYDGSNNQLKMYLNGVEQEVNQAAGQFSGNILDNSTIDLRIGTTANGQAFDGVIDEVRLWNIVRTGTEIQANMDCYLRGDETGLILYWKMDEGNGTIVIDGSKSGNDGTIAKARWITGLELNAPTAGTDDQYPDGNSPQEFFLGQNYPNPFNTSTLISFDLPQTTFIQLKIFNSQGEMVKLLTKGTKKGGQHQVIWDGTDQLGQKVSSGLYLYHIKTGNIEQTQKMLLIR